MITRLVTLILGVNKLESLSKLKNCVSTTHPLKLLHVDLCGSMRITSRGGKRYVLVIVDDYSRFTWTLASKDETFEKFLVFLKRTKNRVGHSLVSLMSDHGKEFKILSFIDYCTEQGVDHNFSAQEHLSRMGC